MNRQEQTEFNLLKKANALIKARIEEILKKYINEKNKDYSTIWLLIGQAIDNEIEQESYCNK
jgi:hypothetical protein